MNHDNYKVDEIWLTIVVTEEISLSWIIGAAVLHPESGGTTPALSANMVWQVCKHPQGWLRAALFEPRLQICQLWFQGFSTTLLCDCFLKSRTKRIELDRNYFIPFHMFAAPTSQESVQLAKKWNCYRWIFLSITVETCNKASGMPRTKHQSSRAYIFY